MASVQDRAKLKRVSYDTWSTREQLCLASSVLKSGDQNWISVSRSLKPFAEKEALRPPDWFSQKSCAVQYAILLENADAPKRKKRESGETAGESIVRRLTQERIAELGQILAFQRDEYQQLKAEVNLLRSGSITEEKLQKMWLAIEQEDREQEQKARAHSAWLAKRQQKQDVQSLQTVTLVAPRKTLEASTDGQETTDSTNEEEDKKNRGGRSPLLTSLLKSPSPTTQIQTTTSSAQVTSPTIASLLGSTSKVTANPQVSQGVSQQLHQLVSTAITNTVQERPSVGAPTLSMLLELPANLQRSSLASMQTAVASAPQQTPPPEIHVQSHPVKQTLPQNEPPVVRTPTIPTTPSIPVTEEMVQIIDHIDDVIRKDIMADVIDKDEINEIIGDIEEFIKEDITASPQTIPEPPPTATIIENLPVPEIEKVAVPERPEPRDVDEAVSLSNSPQSEMAIEEIDQSTSNIAEIIGTVAIEPVEPKITIVPALVEEPAKKEEKEKEPELKEDPKSESESVVNAQPETAPEKEDISEKTEVAVEKKAEKVVEEVKEKSEEVTVAEIGSKTPEDAPKTSPESATEKESDEAELPVTTPEADDSVENPVDQKESVEETKGKSDEQEFDQIELHLAKITGDQNDAGSAEVVSVCSEVTADAPSIEDTEKSQDIGMILEDDESSQSNTSKKKDTDEQSISENAVEGSDSQQSFKEETTTSKDAKKETTTEPTAIMETAEIEATPEKIEDEAKIEDSKDCEATMSPAVPEVEKSEKPETKSEETILPDPEKTSEEPEKTAGEEKEKTAPAESSKPQVPEIEIKKCESPIVTDEKPEVKEESEADSLMEQLEEPKKEEPEIKEEPEEDTKPAETELTVKKEPVESAGSVGDDIGDLDEEESSLSKLSGGRAMKTYSKKQTIAVDSEPENESSGENADYRAWKKSVMLVYGRLATHKFASAFLRPITEDHAPGYHSVIFRPMDLTTIKKNIDNGTIRSTMHFQRDVMLMFQNAIMYNKHDTYVYKMAVTMQEECLQHMQLLVHVSGDGQLRRETRTAASSSSETSESSVKRKRSHITPSPHDSESPRGKKRRKSEND